VLAQSPCQAPRVDVLDGDDVRVRERGREVALGAPRRRAVRHLAHDEAGDLDLVGLGVVGCMP
jgi:hypothetical protein